MIFIEPDFYSGFKCIADKCRHSCCIGWEIDIDHETAEFYKEIDGQGGLDFGKHISDEPSPHFVQDKDGRCPFLTESGLCRIINVMGEDGLCEICYEHPRFYNFYANREESGLGLCCEEAARLLLEGRESLSFSSFDDEESQKPDENEESLFALKEQLFSEISRHGIPMGIRMKKAMELCGEAFAEPDISKWAEFLMGLERLDEEWTGKLRLLCEKADTVSQNNVLDDIRYERLLAYFVYRHFSSAECLGRAGTLMEFCILSVYFICSLDVLEGFDVEHSRMFSSEIEYSDENIEIILKEIERIRQ